MLKIEEVSVVQKEERPMSCYLKCRHLLRDYEIKREQKIIEHNNTGSIYRFVNNKLSCMRGLGALGDGKGGVIVRTQNELIYTQ